MKKMIKNLIIPCIIVFLFAIVYLIIIPKMRYQNALNNIFTKFEEGLTNLEINYEKIEVDSTIFGAKRAYSYTSNEKTIMLYVYSNNSKYYNQGLKDGFVKSQNNDDSRLYGVMNNNCILYMESEFPKDIEVLELFQNLSKEYLDAM